MNHFSANLTYLRNRFAIKQNQLASYMNKAQTTIANWENKKSEPDIEELIKIIQYFGVTVDTMLFVDLESGNLITDAHVAEFKATGKVNSNLIGKKLKAYDVFSEDRDGGKSVVNEPDPVKDWAFTKILQGMDGKLDQLLDLAQNKPKKKA